MMPADQCKPGDLSLTRVAGPASRVRIGLEILPSSPVGHCARLDWRSSLGRYRGIYPASLGATLGATMNKADQ